MLLRKHVPISYVAGSVVRDAVLLTFLTCGVYTVQQYPWGNWFTVPISLISVLGTSISLLLAFRTNQSYDRWWEARTVWGGIVNDSRSLVRQLLTFIPGDHAAGQEIVHRVARRQIAWGYALGRSLRGQAPLSDLEALLTPEEFAEMARFDNKPNALLLKHAPDLQRLAALGLLDTIQTTQLDDTVTKLCDHMGRCERIKSTVFPVTYSLYLHAFIYFFILIIPFGLGSSFGLSEVPLAAGIGVCFFLIEKSATLLQDPFENRPTDTSVTTIATSIHRTLLQMIGEEAKQPEPFPAQKFYAM